MNFSLKRQVGLTVVAGAGSWLIGLLAVAIVGVQNPTYLVSPWKNHYPDAIDYLTLSQSIVAKGVFSRTSDGRPDLLRTPLYPLILAACTAHHNPILLYVLQIGMLATSVALIVRTAKNCFGTCSALCVMILLWSDYRLHMQCLEAMSEISSLFFMVVGLYVLRWPSFPFDSPMTWWRSIWSGVALSASVMIRPSIVYMPLILAIAAVAKLLWTPNSLHRSMLGPIFVFVLVFLISPALWTARNWYVFGIPKLTSVGGHNLVYFVGAGAFQVKYGIDRFQAQSMLAEKYQIPSYTTVQNPYSQDAFSVRELENRLRASQWKILCAHPIALLGSSLIGISKASVDHSLVGLAHLLGSEWHNPGLKGLLSFHWEAWNKLFQNQKLLVTAFFLHGFRTTALFIGAAVGCYKAFQLRVPSAELFGMILVFLYGYFVVAMFGVDATYRSTIVAMPSTLLLVGYSMFRPARLQVR